MNIVTISARDAAHGRTAKHSRPHREHATLILDDHCNIDDCNPSGEELFGYSRSELIGQPISILLPELSKTGMLRGNEPNPHLKFLTRIGHRFKGVEKGGRHFACELFLNFLHNPGSHFATIIAVPAEKDEARRPAALP